MGTKNQQISVLINADQKLDKLLTQLKQLFKIEKSIYEKKVKKKIIKSRLKNMIYHKAGYLECIYEVKCGARRIR